MRNRKPDRLTTFAILAVTAALAAVLVMRLSDPRPPPTHHPNFHGLGRR